MPPRQAERDALERLGGRGGRGRTRGGARAPPSLEEGGGIGDIGADRPAAGGTGTSSTPPASQAGSEGTGVSEGDSGARGVVDASPRLAGRRQRSSFSGNLSGGGGSTAGDLGETGGTTSGGEEEVHHPSHSGAGGSAVAGETSGDGDLRDASHRHRPPHHADLGSDLDDTRNEEDKSELFSRDSSPTRSPRERESERVWEGPARFDAGPSRSRSGGGARADPGDSARLSGPTGSFSGVISGVAGSAGGSGGHGITVSSGFGGGGADFRGTGAYSSRREGVRGAHSSSRKMHKSVRFATTIDDGGQRTGSRGRYSPPPSPPRSVGRAGREQREDTPPGARGAREDTPPAPGNSVDSEALGGTIGGGGAILDDGVNAAAMIIAGAAEVMGGGDVGVVPGDVMRADLRDLDGDPGNVGVVGLPKMHGDGDPNDGSRGRERVSGSIARTGGVESSVLGKRDGDDAARKDGERSSGPPAKRPARGVSPPPPQT